MADRVVQDSRLGREGLRPAATPVDTFVRPQRDTNLISLAESLSSIAPVVGGLASTLRQKKQERDAERGAEDVSVEMQGGKSAGDALATVNPAKSGAYKAAAKKQASQLAAFNYGSALNTYMTENLADETDLGEFNRKVDTFTQAWVKGNTPADGEFLRGFQRQAAAIRQNAVQQMSWRVGERKRQQTEEEFGTLVGKAVDGEFNWTAPEGRDARIAGAVGSLRERAFAMGIRGSRINQLIFDNISALAIAQGKPELADTLFNVPTGPNGSVKLGDIPEFKQKIAAASHAAEVNANRRDTAKIQKRADNSDNILSQMQGALITAIESGLDPATVDITPYKKLMNDPESGDPDKVAGLESARQAFLVGHKRETVPVIEESLLERMYDPDHPLGKKELLDTFLRGGMGNDTYLKFHRLIDSRDKVRAARKALRPDQLMGEGMRMVGENVDGSGLAGETGNIMKGRIRKLLRQQMYEWLETEEGMKADAEAVRAHGRLLAETLTDSLGKKKRTSTATK